jgi:hypothetical protein
LAQIRAAGAAGQRFRRMAALGRNKRPHPLATSDRCNSASRCTDDFPFRGLPGRSFWWLLLLRLQPGHETFEIDETSRALRELVLFRSDAFDRRFKSIRLTRNAGIREGATAQASVWASRSGCWQPNEDWPDDRCTKKALEDCWPTRNELPLQSRSSSAPILAFLSHNLWPRQLTSKLPPGQQILATKKKARFASRRNAHLKEELSAVIDSQ